MLRSLFWARKSKNERLTRKQRRTPRTYLSKIMKNIRKYPRASLLRITEKNINAIFSKKYREISGGF